MQFLIVISVIFIIFLFIFYFQKPAKVESKSKDFHNIIIYVADFLAKNPQEITINLDDVLYSELLNFVKVNSSRISQFEQLDSTSITFVIPINNSEYKVYASKFVFDQLVIAAKNLKK